MTKTFKKLTAILLALTLCVGLFTSSAYADEGEVNYPLNTLIIKLEAAVTHSMLAYGRFEVFYSNAGIPDTTGGNKLATVDTDPSGVIIISGLQGGYYVVRQTVPPNNYHLSITNEQHVFLSADGTSVAELTFSDYRYGGLLVFLTDKDTGKPVAGATFSVTDVDGRAVGNAADGVYATDAQGEFYLENLPAGDYKITQLTAAQGYAMDSNPNMRTVRL